MNPKQLYDLVNPVCSDRRVGWPINVVSNSRSGVIELAKWVDRKGCLYFEPIEEHTIAILEKHLMEWIAEHPKVLYVKTAIHRHFESRSVEINFIGDIALAEFTGQTTIEALVDAVKKVLEEKIK